MLSTSGNAIDSRYAISANIVRWLCGLAAVSLTWLFVHTQDPFFKVDPKYHLPALGPPPEKYNAFLEQQTRVDRQNSALIIGIFGGILGAGFALSFADKRGSWKHLIAGGFMGMAFGAVAGLAGCLMQYNLISQGMLAMTQSCTIYGLVFGLFGMGMGAVLGGLQGKVPVAVKASLTGLIAGGLGGILYPIAASLLIPSADIEPFMPLDTTARLLLLAVPTVCIALLIPSAINENTAGQRKSGAFHSESSTVGTS